MAHWLLWSCGPVQDFIASARKGRDLWFGSWMLSEAATAAADALLGEGSELLLPAPSSRAELNRADFDVPNKVLARVTQDPERLGKLASDAARGRLLTLARETFERCPPNAIDRGPALAQVGDLLDTAWAAVLDSGDFRRDRRTVEALLAARKSSRTFGPPVHAAAGVQKSSLDGQREVVTAKAAGLRIGLNEDERLCGVGLLKRMGHEAAPKDAPGGKVSSVSSFAAAPWLRPALLRDAGEVRAALVDFRRALHTLRDVDSGRNDDPVLQSLNAHALYTSRVRELTSGDDVERATETQRSALRALSERLSLQGAPSPYYAILHADGDKMGVFLDEQDKDGVREVSKALACFAADVRQKVFGPGTLDAPQTLLRGQCVYAGGDDVLALAPVDVALAQAHALSRAFAAHMDALPPKVRARAALPTLSVGVAVGHHLTPLREVLDAARSAERLAKNNGRNAWAVRVLKRSGAPTEAWGSWSDGSLERMERLREAFGVGGALPHGLPYTLRDAGAGLRRLSRGNAPPIDLQRAELKRVLRQKGLWPGSEATTALIDDLWATSANGLEPLSNRLITARALAGLGERQ